VAGAVLRATSLSFRFPQSSAPLFEDLSLEFKPGDVWSIVGPSGCGKSTLLRLLLGLEALQAGQVQRETKRVGVVFQSGALIPWLRVQEQLSMAAEWVGESKDTVHPWLEKFYLQNARDLYPHELSGGMKMRAALARAMISRPELLFLDEAFASLDESLREELDELLLTEARRNQMTCVVVTHQMMEAAYLSTHVLALGRGARSGRLVFHENPKNRVPDDFWSPQCMERAQQIKGLLRSLA